MIREAAEILELTQGNGIRESESGGAGIGNEFGNVRIKNLIPCCKKLEPFSYCDALHDELIVMHKIKFCV